MPEPRRNACMSASTRWHRQSSGPAVNPAHRAFHSQHSQSRVRPVMVQPDIQQRSGLDQAKQSGTSSAFRTPDVCGLQLIQRSEPKVGQHCLARHPPPSARHRVILWYVLRLTTYGVSDAGLRRGATLRKAG
jgi:hypothetical protein